MSHHSQIKRLSIRDIACYKQEGKKIVCLTAHSAPVARILDAHIDLFIIGDSLGMVVYGFDSTLPVTLDMMIAHAKAVADASEQACLVVDLPFGSYQASPEQAFSSAAHVICETGAQAVKLEGGVEMAPTIAFLSARGIPVMAHIGLMPQHVHAMGGYRYQGRTALEERSILHAAQALEDAGAFALLLEGMKESIAVDITEKARIPTIGIGASAACDGQVLVTEDMLGLNQRPAKFVRSFAHMHNVIKDATQAYAHAVRSGDFPSDSECYGIKKDSVKTE